MLTGYKNFDWKTAKRSASILAAVLLLVVSSICFTTGISFGGEWGFLVSGSVWLALTIIQVIGNDEENHVDGVFTVGWIFSYILGVGASTWAMYSWIEVPNEIIRWTIAFGLGGVTEILPEKLIVVFFKAMSGERARTTRLGQPNVPLAAPRQPAAQSRPVQKPVTPAYTPQYRPQTQTSFQSQRPENRPQPPKNPPPSYSRIVRDEDDGETYLGHRGQK